MKIRFFFFGFLLLFCVSLQAQDLPVKALGKYAGVKPAYTAIKNEVEFSIEAQDVFITIKEGIIFFEIGKLSLSDGYTASKIDGGNYSIKAAMTNEKSLNYDLEFLWSKKTETLTIIGKNGEPDTVMEKLD